MRESEGKHTIHRVNNTTTVLGAVIRDLSDVGFQD